LLLLAAGLGAYLAGRRVWAAHHRREAEQALAHRDFPQARHHLACCLEVWPGDVAIQLLAAQAARRGGDFDAATGHLNRCLELGASTQTIALEAKLLLAQRGELTPAVETTLKARLQDQPPETPLILEALIVAYMQSGRYLEARSGVEALLEQQPDHVQAHTWHGEVLERLQHPKPAIAAYRRAVELDPDSAWARLSLGELLLYLTRTDEAVEHFEFLHQRQPDNAAVTFGLARCWRRQGRTDEGLILSERGRLAMDECDFVQAERWLRQAVSRWPTDRQTNYALSQCLEQRGRKDEAKVYQARADAIEADEKRVLELTEQIVKSPDGVPEARYELGVVCLRLGREKDGMRWLQSVLQQDPRHAAAHRALAEHYAGTGRADLAARHRRLATGNARP
jgi:tetratricopeptide (TPR) repeat protein